MRALRAADFLELWERGRRLHPVDQGLLALGAAFPDTAYEALADWPLGRRNRELARLRCSSFGSRLEGWISCPQCGEKLEFEMDSSALAEGEDPAAKPVEVGGQTFRLPTSRDLARIAREGDPRTAVARLLESCRLEPAPAPPACTEADLDEIGDRLAKADPAAETRLALVCAACRHEWVEALDITAFLWAEIEARARRLLFEIHALASAYGWSEAAILALSEARRALYLEMVRS
ncbi:MAG TPA: hypothetical protein VGS58_14650 [Candidatus Sulfopaludibacter sp.]|nr:hypothetical protein [Candidatus Sulfopaludibacter sp.]